MDAEEIEKKLTHLGQATFRKIVSLVLRRALLFDAVNVDGSGDGGSDWRAFDDHGQRLRIAIQDTVQQQGWENKAVDDATKAKTELGVNRYIFFTNRHHHQTTTVQLERKITKKTGLDARIYEARVISQLIHAKGLVNDFLALLGEAVANRPPELPEMSLCAYGNLSADRRNHRDQIYNDTLLVTCRDLSPAPSREKLVDSAIAALGTTNNQRPLLEKRVDWLMTQKEIRKTPTGNIELTPVSSARLDQTERLYLADWAALEGAQAALMKSHMSDWTADDARKASAFLARMFIKNQFDAMSHARVENVTANWSSRLGQPEQQLRDLLQAKGVTIRNIGKAMKELVDLASNRDVITKLTRTAVFVALEGQDPMLSATALGRRSWDEVNVLLDSSVAIPFICEKLNGAVKDYIYSVSGHAVDLFQDLKSRCFILPGHIEECAAHLIQASRYYPLENTQELSGALKESENAFVAYHAALPSSDGIAKITFADFLAQFSRQINSITKRYTDLPQATRAVMPDLQQLFGDYQVKFQFNRRPTTDRFSTLQKGFDLACFDAKQNRPAVLREHDVDALAYLASSTEQKDESWMMLTWDKLFIQFAQQALPSTYVVSPEMAMDFAQPCRRLTDTEFCGLAHRLARTTPIADGLTAKIIDRVASFDPEKLRDGAFRRQLLEFRDEARENLPDAESDRVESWMERQANEFLKQHNIHPKSMSVDQSSPSPTTQA